MRENEKSEKMHLASTAKPQYRTGIEHKGWKQQRLRRVLLLKQKYREGVEHKGLKQQRLIKTTTTARQRSLCSM